MFRREDSDRRWFVVDAREAVLGRLATKVAVTLRGKNSPQFTPHDDVGDFVIVINASKVATTGTKSEYKYYHRHSGYHGGGKQVPYSEMMERHPERIVSMAIKGMLPKNRLGRRLLKKLRVYAGSDHPHKAQRPEPLSV
jgi:large subunit ribosomal protein L13